MFEIFEFGSHKSTIACAWIRGDASPTRRVCIRLLELTEIQHRRCSYVAYIIKDVQK